MSKLKCHLFICTNDRGTGKESCAQKGAQELRDRVKEGCKKFPKDQVRVNNAGCLGHCEKGIAAVLYPQGEWLFELKKENAEKLVDLVEKSLQKN